MENLLEIGNRCYLKKDIKSLEVRYLQSNFVVTILLDGKYIDIFKEKVPYLTEQEKECRLKELYSFYKKEIFGKITYIKG